MSALRRSTLVNDIIDMGNWIVTGTWKSQFRRDPGLFTETKKIFEKVYPKLDELKAITHQDVDLKRIEECRQAAKAYEGTMAEFLSKWLEREEMTKKRGVVADEVLQLAKATLSSAWPTLRRGPRRRPRALPPPPPS